MNIVCGGGAILHTAPCVCCLILEFTIFNDTLYSIAFIHLFNVTRCGLMVHSTHIYVVNSLLLSLIPCCLCQTSLSMISIRANNNKKWHKVSILARIFRYSVHPKMLCHDVFIISQWPFRQIICVYVAIERGRFQLLSASQYFISAKTHQSHENRRKKRNLWACMANCISIEYVSRSHSRTLCVSFIPLAVSHSLCPLSPLFVRLRDYVFVTNSMCRPFCDAANYKTYLQLNKTNTWSQGLKCHCIWSRV